jgi:hypothetical protein
MIDKSTDFRLMALLPDILEVIGKQSDAAIDSSLSSAVTFSVMQNAALIHMGYCPRRLRGAAGLICSL